MQQTTIEPVAVDGGPDAITVLLSELRREALARGFELSIGRTTVAEAYAAACLAVGDLNARVSVLIQMLRVLPHRTQGSVQAVSVGLDPLGRGGLWLDRSAGFAGSATLASVRPARISTHE